MILKQNFITLAMIATALLFLTIILQGTLSLPAITPKAVLTIKPKIFTTVVTVPKNKVPITTTKIPTTNAKQVITTSKIIITTLKTPITTIKPVIKTGTTPRPVITTKKSNNTFNPNAIPDLENFIRKVRNNSRGKPDAAVGRSVSAWRPGFHHPEELGSYTQGDILTLMSQPRAGITDLSYRWPKGVVYYNINGNFTDSQRALILVAMNEYHVNTCVRFVQYDGSQRDYVSIESSYTGCWSNLGRNGGKQYVNFQPPSCFYYVGTIIHELMHMIGFFHEQSRMDRDNYIGVAFENVISGKEYNFDTYESFTYNVSYDYGSVMHYSQYAFTKNQLPTINKPSNISIGQRLALSALDIEKIRAMYKCIGNVSTLT